MGQTNSSDEVVDDINMPSGRQRAYNSSVVNTTGVCGYDSLLWLACNQKHLRAKIKEWYEHNPNREEMVKKIKNIRLVKNYFPNNNINPTDKQLMIWSDLIQNSVSLYAWYSKKNPEEWRRNMGNLLIHYSINSVNQVLNDDETRKKFPGTREKQPNWAGRVYYYMMAIKSGVTAQDILDAQQEAYKHTGHKFEWDDLGSFAADLLNFVSILFRTKPYDYDYLSPQNIRFLPVLQYEEKTGRRTSGNVIAFVPIIHIDNVQYRDTSTAFLHEKLDMYGNFNFVYFDKLIGMSGTKMLKENGGCTPHAIAWTKHDADPNASEEYKRYDRWHHFDNGKVVRQDARHVKTIYKNYLMQRTPEEGWIFIYRFTKDEWNELLIENNLDSEGKPTLKSGSCDIKKISILKF